MNQKHSRRRINAFAAFPNSAFAAVSHRATWRLFRRRDDGEEEEIQTRKRAGRSQPSSKIRPIARRATKGKVGANLAARGDSDTAGR